MCKCVCVCREGGGRVGVFRCLCLWVGGVNEKMPAHMQLCSIYPT